jgi:serine kinase of HPr protein (carbohydrate metabolism regulator)
MQISDLSNNPHFELVNQGENNQINDIFVSDLMSHVMGNASPGDLLVTVLNNINVIGVVSLLDLSGVVFTHNIKISEDIIKKANDLDIPIYKTKLSTKDTVVLLHEISL